METGNKLDNFLKGHMNTGEEPSPGLVDKARLAVLSRRRQDKKDFFLQLARFLNFNVRLSYAAAVLFCIGFASFYFVKENSVASENVSSSYTVNIPSARSSTVLSSITTFETRR